MIMRHLITLLLVASFTSYVGGAHFSSTVRTGYTASEMERPRPIYLYSTGGNGAEQRWNAPRPGFYSFQCGPQIGANARPIIMEIDNDTTSGAVLSMGEVPLLLYVNSYVLFQASATVYRIVVQPVPSTIPE